MHARAARRRLSAGPAAPPAPGDVCVLRDAFVRTEGFIPKARDAFGTSYYTKGR